MITQVTSKLNPAASNISEENSKQFTTKARLLNFRLTEAYEEILKANRPEQDNRSEGSAGRFR